LLEKRPFLWEEDFKTLANGDLRFIRFHLAEIGLDCGVQDQTVLDDEFRIQAPIKLCRTRIEGWKVRIAQIEATKRTKQAIGYELHVAYRRNVFHSSNLAILRDDAVLQQRVLRLDGSTVGLKHVALKTTPP